MSETTPLTNRLAGLVNRLPARVRDTVDRYLEVIDLARELKDPKVARSLAPAGLRGLILRRGKQGTPTQFPASHNAHFDWTYPADHDDMRDLYDRAKRGQWDGATYLPWQTSVDPMNPEVPILPDGYFDFSILEDAAGVRLTAQQQLAFKHSLTAWMLSQFLHGEQGALQAACQVTEAVQFFDGKLYGGTQVVDEARHVEVYDRYLREKIGTGYPVSEHLKSLLDVILEDTRWDMKYLGMQLMVEGLALAAFGLIHRFSDEPLLKEIVHLVMRDEARHVAFGVIGLRGIYEEMSPSELRDREDFIIEGSRLMRDRFLAQEVWEKMGMPVDECVEYATNAPSIVFFRSLLFSKIVPNLKRLGLLTPYVRPHLAQLGVLQFESFDPDADQDAIDSSFVFAGRHEAAPPAAE